MEELDVSTITNIIFQAILVIESVYLIYFLRSYNSSRTRVKMLRVLRWMVNFILTPTLLLIVYLTVKKIVKNVQQDQLTGLPRYTEYILTIICCVADLVVMYFLLIPQSQKALKKIKKSSRDEMQIKRINEKLRNYLIVTMMIVLLAIGFGLYF